MQEVIIKKDSNIKLDDGIKNYLNPRFIFLPIERGFKLKVKDADYVYKNDIVAMNTHGKMVTSSISGKVLGVKEMTYYKDKRIPSLVIENDFKENMRVRKSAKKYLGDYTKKDILTVLEDTSLKYKGVYTADKLKKEYAELIVNGVELEPYFANKYYTLKGHIEEILETVDLLAAAFAYTKVLFVIKNTDSEVITELMNVLGTYPNITLKLINDAYPNGMSEVLKSNLGMPHALVLEIEEIFDIYNSLKREVPVSEKLITVVGNAVKPSMVIRVKIGSLLSEVFVNNFDFTRELVDVHLNGMMRGSLVTSLKYVIDSDIEGILVEEKSNRVTEACLSCGQCSKYCPMKLNPKYVYDHKGRVRDEYYNTCIECGLCNYVCPSNIDLKSYMKGRE